MESPFKYTLIVSQYYYSRHFFIVHHTHDFLEKARLFAAELMEYKRSGDNPRPIRLGDLDPEWSSGNIRGRYNINDTGDIYFIQGNYANRLMEESWEFRDTSKRESRGFQSKQVMQDISKNHDRTKVRAIVEKHFEIA
ncbi:hypothetical protein [Paenibacillus cymbidii]|uniref:hypothetical protein n=1 Tax=Paenibacillus cymbidii TaxID=1639034 RepID=UPI0010816F4B|nr:hypothetical protein [Paenibacillus cymbidii]